MLSITPGETLDAGETRHARFSVVVEGGVKAGRVVEDGFGTEFSGLTPGTF
jgi:hypothetical protein